MATMEYTDKARIAKAIVNLLDKICGIEQEKKSFDNTNILKSFLWFKWEEKPYLDAFDYYYKFEEPIRNCKGKIYILRSLRSMLAINGIITINDEEFKIIKDYT